MMIYNGDLSIKWRLKTKKLHGQLDGEMTGIEWRIIWMNYSELVPSGNLT